MGAWDSPWHFIVLAVVLVLLFGSKRLPDAARSLGKSMRIFRAEMRGMHEDEAAQPAPPAALPPAAQPPTTSAAPPPTTSAAPPATPVAQPPVVPPGPVSTAEPAEPGDPR